MTPSPFVPLGRVVKTHGLKGEVSVVMAADLPFVLPDDIEVWFVPPPSGIRSGRFEGMRQGPKGPLVKVAGIDDISTAQRVVGTQLMVRAEDLPEGWDDEIEEEPDVIGYTVTEETRGLLGEIVEIIVTGANDVWVVEGPLGEVLLPVIDDVVLEIDDDAETVLVHALPGLLPGEEDEA